MGTNLCDDECVEVCLSPKLRLEVVKLSNASVRYTTVSSQNGRETEGVKYLISSLKKNTQKYINISAVIGVTPTVFHV